MSMSWVGSVVLSILAAAPQEGVRATALVGVWVLNADESDDAREKLQEAMRDRFRGRGGRRPGRGGPGGGGLPGGGGFPGGGGPPGGERGFPGRDGGEGDRGPGALLDGYDRLEIFSGPEEIQIAYGDRLRIYRPDGREVERRTDRGLTRVRARWDDARLVVEADGERADSREVFERDGERLVLTQVIDGPMGQVKIRRVYDRGEPEADSEDAAPPDPIGAF